MKRHATWLVGIFIASAGCSSSSGGANNPPAPEHDAGTDDAVAKQSSGKSTPKDAGHAEAAASGAEAAASGAEAAAKEAAAEATTSDAAPAEYSITAKIALTKDADGQTVSFPTQNGSTVAIAVSDLVGKTVYWLTGPEGVAVTNLTMPLDQGISTIEPDLTTTWTTGAHYPTGAYELACVISVTGTPPPNIPAAGDLAAFDNSPPPSGEQPDTGDSVRVHVMGANLTVTLDNPYFIRFGT